MTTIQKQLTVNTDRIQTILKFTYGLVPIIAGLDKFTNLLTDWTGYVPAIVPMEAGLVMSLVGVIEIIAGILVFMKPKIGSMIVMVWLVLIAIVLIIGGQFDIAVRDLVMAVGAYTLYTLTVK